MVAAAEHFDVITIGEVLLEINTVAEFSEGVPARLGISGDALNVAAAAAAAGARTAICAVLTDDDLGRAIARQVAALGISTELITYRHGQQGMYLVHSDPDGEREFSYARAGSIGSSISVADLDEVALRSARAVITSGITGALSASSREVVERASRLAARFVYDPNFRSRLTTADAARSLLESVAATAYLVTPSYALETSTLLGRDTAVDAAARLLELGTERVAVTCGSTGVQLADREGSSAWVPAVPAPEVIDQTGAGDCFVGTLTARLVLGDSFGRAVQLAASAASLSVGGRGGLGFVPTLEQVLAHAGGPSQDGGSTQRAELRDQGTLS